MSNARDAALKAVQDSGLTAPNGWGEVFVSGDEAVVVPAPCDPVDVGAAPVLVKGGEVRELATAPFSWPAWFRAMVREN
ncbi:hypothetical protein [Corynebacterium sp.]|uniref:hypothetical protein n=1 Tax=Corynebacterium sp. TaxID=1720 RepID=UPI002A91C52F|nr:hypothetical protein [Corynebacterium sp.]MDY5785870.1 hypothetical protein [Corynebacterium sp.]